MSKFKSYNINQLDKIPQLMLLDHRQMEDIRIVSEIYPFKTNNYVLENLINWTNVPDDPIFRLNFPHKEMLTELHYDQLKWGMRNMDEVSYRNLIHDIRLSLNPHPAGQVDHNTPYFLGEKLEGMQHKYRNTILFFPSHSQTCHAYCTFCFRWPQFVNEPGFKMQAKEIDPLVAYLRANPYITDVLLTGGDPMVMSPRILANYLLPLLEVKSLKVIRIGTKSLSYWPHKFVTDPDKDELLQLLGKVAAAGKHLAIMAHFNHYVEFETAVAQEAIFNLRKIGAEIRTQAPLLRNINNKVRIWSTMWERQVQLGCVPYYMFLPRDTGAQHYFAESLETALHIYRGAIQLTGGLCRTARGPVMSMTTGKVELLDIEDDAYQLRFLQHRNSALAFKTFRARARNEQPKWFDDLACYDERYREFFADQDDYDRNEVQYGNISLQL